MIVDGPYHVSVDQPLDPSRPPREAVRVKRARRRIDGVIELAVVQRHVSLAKERSLHCVVIGARPLEIDLVAVGRGESEGGGNSGAGSRSHLDIDSPKEDVLWDFNLGCVGFAGQEEDEPLPAEVKVERAVDLGDVITEGSVSEVDVNCFS